ncbi:MAG: hypothetical protein E7376_03095 [Clostridiales bacterium]|nr:hypothetical protein [Clostridiales bacterium]
MNTKIVCFIGHRFSFRVSAKQKRVYKAIGDLIKKGYTTFYTGNMGSFDDVCEFCVLSYKYYFPKVKLYKISATPYIKDTASNYIYDDIIVPELEHFHYKQRITKRNEWMVDHCDLVLCNITNDIKSGAFNTVKYARKIGKPIIYLD